MRGGMARGLDLSDLASRLSASLALPADLFDGIANVAPCAAGGGIVSALGLDPNTHRLFLQGAVSVRMFSLVDDEVNMLRTTTALLGGAIGGADQPSAHAHDCLGGKCAAGRRLARMQQHLLIEESGPHAAFAALAAPDLLRLVLISQQMLHGDIFRKLRRTVGQKWPICQASLTC